jgi:hypothetical protein
VVAPHGGARQRFNNDLSRYIHDVTLIKQLSDESRRAQSLQHGPFHYTPPHLSRQSLEALAEPPMSEHRFTAWHYGISMVMITSWALLNQDDILAGPSLRNSAKIIHEWTNDLPRISKRSEYVNGSYSPLNDSHQAMLIDLAKDARDRIALAQLALVH